VQAMYERLRNGDAVGALAMWDDRATWHLTGQHEFARDYDPDEYLAMLGQWAAAYPSYQAHYAEARDVGEDVALIVLESTGGMAPGQASGLLIYRVVDGRIREGWGVPTFAEGRYAF